MNLENECPKQGNALQDESYSAHHKHKRQDLFLPFMFIRDVRSLEPTRSRFDKEAPADGSMPVSD